MARKKKIVKKEDKLRILAAGDFHGSVDLAKRASAKATKEKVDLVVLAGDIHGPREGVDVLAPFRKAKQKVVFVPGNWDTTKEAAMLRGVHGMKNLDGYYANYKGVDIVGLGNPDFELVLDEEKASKKLNSVFEKIKTKKGKKILVSHMHARGTKAEFSGFAGSEALRRAIDEFKPDLFISGHIHEAEGIEEKIGRTRVVNVGREGKILVI